MLHADLILFNGNIVTLNSKQPRAQAVAIKNGRFVAVGNNNQVLLHSCKGAKKIDLKCKTAVPGFIDTHVHGGSLGRCLSQVNLRDTKSIREIQKRLRQRTKRTPSGEWVIGRGLDQEKLAEGRFPSRFDLDEAVPNNPVFLTRVCGHLGVVNSEALRLAGITEKTRAPEGGCIDRDENGVPNGILRENALNLVYDVLPKQSVEQETHACLLACRKMVEEGITTAHWIVSSSSEMRALQKLKGQNALPLRIYALIPVEWLNNLEELGLSTGFGDDKLKVGSLKILLDGSLGARTAALKKPYNDAPETAGMMLYSRRQLKAFVEKGHELGLQLAIHAIGDKTIEAALNALGKTLEKTPRKDHRHRLEHVSVLDQKLVYRMRELGVLASVQPHFIISDFWIADRLGETRNKWAYAFKNLLRARVKVMAGSDAPVEPVSPILGIYAAVARKTNPQEKLSFDEALKMYTINAAYGSFEEESKGTIEAGKLADLVVLSQNPYKTDPEKLEDIKVEMTVVDGNVVYARRQ
jgi:hypothetical protein